MSAATIHARLLSALRELRRAERNAVLLFGEVMRRELFKELGYATIQIYAVEALGFTPSKTSQFVRLAGALKSLPRLRRSVASGELGWTKAREVAKVATPRSESNWIAVAKRSSSRGLEREVRAARQRTRAAARVEGQAALALEGADAASAPEPAPITVTVSFTPEQYARYEALVETIRKRGGRRDSSVRGMARAELLLAALNDLAEGLDGEAKPARSAPPYQVVVYTCEECGAAEARTDRGSQPMPAAVVQCDARIQEPDRPNRATNPPKIRRAALRRAGHRCESPGCGRTRFLEVHHRRVRAKGGGHDLANLQVLCSACHRHAHRRDDHPRAG
ncbi:HNH endonuclease [bacterium]|nr:HNH endonuclease [bacterium]